MYHFLPYITLEFHTLLNLTSIITLPITRRGDDASNFKRRVFGYLLKKRREKKRRNFFSQQIPLALVANPPVFTPISHQIWENINKWRRYSEMPGRYQSPDRLLYVHLQYFFLCVPGWNYSILHKGYLLSIHGKSIWELGSFPLYRCAL